MLTPDEERIAMARLAHAVFPDECFPEFDDEAGWDALVERGRRMAEEAGVDLDALGREAEARVLERIRREQEP